MEHTGHAPWDDIWDFTPYKTRKMRVEWVEYELKDPIGKYDSI